MNHKYQNEYYLVSLRGQPILTIPKISKYSRIKSVKFYPDQTWKKKIFKKFLHLSFCLGIENILHDKKKDFSFLDSMLDFDRWLQHISSNLFLPDNHFTVVWPPETRRKRLYVYFFDESCNLSAFGKFSLDAKNNERIANESKTLSLFSEKSFNSTKIPKVLFEGLWNNSYYLVTQSLPPGSKLINSQKDSFPKKNVREYSGSIKKTSFDQFKDLFWWRDFGARTARIPRFAQEVYKIAVNGINTCHVHGDLGSTNVFEHQDKLWFIDWERSSAKGPMLVDDVAFYVGTHHLEIKRNRKNSLREFLQKYLHDELYKQDDVFMALAFLHGAEFSPATRLIEQWENENHP